MLSLPPVLLLYSPLAPPFLTLPIPPLPIMLCRSVSLEGLYPCGEGAGYAGGIVSAAVDGIRVGAAVAEGLTGVNLGLGF